MGRHVVLGKGPVGTATAQLLAERGHEVVVLSRSGGTSTGDVQHRAVDAADGAALSAAVGAADALYNAVNPPRYDRWTRDWPPIAAAVRCAAEDAGVLVVMGSLYGYGRPGGPMTADTPLAATDVKGRLKASMWADALAARAAGRLRVTEARASDFVGPTVPPPQSHVVRQLATLRAGRRAWVIGDPDARHSWTYVPDVAATLVTLGTDARAEGRAWMVPSGEPRSQREVLTDVAAAMGSRPARVSGIPWPVLRALGAADSQMRELVAIRHQWDADFVLDSSETTAVLGLEATPWAEVVQATAQAGTSAGSASSAEGGTGRLKK
ncbi:NAD-dependent epimerase/dehydratase family protein [Modestobacter sp. VKM Ac-2978]|uniref:NAD-dependent epimerase/dehydratase family protein n=1 Tax=Modestobacter sp. VKM Ac-2978 TaxID=3004132 RepID=UPI0022AAE273|nr:NAD-dependent epimerase/dehydratase family protein [Modestobacter sp. VKM Ac-2978]MCZ2848228.1 NAD-dependent epimerase/dehydratase family protein [Modestobacter sp. VKM Ac-2978]